MVDPIPEALRALGVDEYDDVFEVRLGYALVNSRPERGVWDAVWGGYLEDNRSGKLGYLFAFECCVLDFIFDGTPRCRLRPAQLADEYGVEIELRQQVSCL